MTSEDPDVTEKVERTDTGFRLTAESTRGTGTRDQDKVKAELRTEEIPERGEWRAMHARITDLMEYRRSAQPDEEDGDGDD